jgi:hypothetical protein
MPGAGYETNLPKTRASDPDERGDILAEAPDFVALPLRWQPPPDLAVGAFIRLQLPDPTIAGTPAVPAFRVASHAAKSGETSFVVALLGPSHRAHVRFGCAGYLHLLRPPNGRGMMTDCHGGVYWPPVLRIRLR